MKVCALAGVLTACAVANAFLYDATIIIDRALNSPTLTVRYTGASAALAELRLNGVSMGTRSLNVNEASGETNFTLDLSALAIGDNTVEIRLFDKGGKLVGTERTTISADNGAQAPVFVSAPKMGASVQGPVEIKVGFGKSMRNSYVSFFIDNQFKSMTNLPPYSYLWDTSRDANGWHDLEAWVVDDNSNTLKTKKIRVFVNNPQGRTVRKPETPVKAVDPVKPSENPVKPSENPVKPETAKPADPKTTSTDVGKPVLEVVPAAKPPVAELTSENSVKVLPGAAAGTKAIAPDASVATGARNLTPTGLRNAEPAVKVGVRLVRLPVASPTTSVVRSGTTGMIRVAKGERVPNIGTYSIMLDSKYIEFDVQPRVENGIPLTPIRHLLEAADGTVTWENLAKTMTAEAQGRTIVVRIGESVARINNLPVEMEIAAFLERGRTIVPLSFLRDTLDVNIEFDAQTGHVLITSATKK